MLSKISDSAIGDLSTAPLFRKTYTDEFRALVTEKNKRRLELTKQTILIQYGALDSLDPEDKNRTPLMKMAIKISLAP